MDIPVDKNSKISYFDFIRSVDDGRESKHQKIRSEIRYLDPVLLGKFYSKLNGEKFVEKLKPIVTAQYYNLHNVSQFNTKFKKLVF